MTRAERQAQYDALNKNQTVNDRAKIKQHRIEHKEQKKKELQSLILTPHQQIALTEALIQSLQNVQINHEFEIPKDLLNP